MAKKIRYYNLIAFVGGMSIMAIEMTAVRIMSPYFGSSIFIWTNILGVIMVALALGYYYGGKLADKYPRPQVFYFIVLMASVIVLALPFIATPLLEYLSSVTGSSPAAWVTLSLLGSLALFFVPFALLGMISPYLIRLVNREVEETGRVAGRIFAVSTFGSIVGTFLPTLVTVPLLGVQRTIVIFGAALCVIAAIGLNRRVITVMLIILTGLGIAFAPLMMADKNVIAYSDSPYSYIEIRKYLNYSVLSFSKTRAVQSMQPESGYLTGGFYVDYYSVLPAFACPSRECDIGVIGVAGGTIPRLLDHYYAEKKDLAIDGIELDPAVTRLAKKYFDYSIPTLTTHHQDGRIYLRHTDKIYNLIVLDAFQEVEIPPHLSSREFFQIAKDHLATDGIMAINIMTSGSQNSQYQRFLSTLQEDFAQVWDIGLNRSSNHLVLASNTDEPLTDRLAAAEIDNELSNLRSYIYQNMVRPDPIHATLITDDRPLTQILYDTMLYQSEI